MWAGAISVLMWLKGGASPYGLMWSVANPHGFMEPVVVDGRAEGRLLITEMARD